MKVDSSPDSYIGSVAGGPHKVGAHNAAATDAAAASAAAKPQAGVQVTLSSTTQSMTATSGSGSDVFNAEKVEAMKQAIANGSFQVNAEAIADKMLSNAAEMLNSARS